MYGRYCPVAILLLLVISVSFSLSGQTPTDEPWSAWLYTPGDPPGLTQPQPQLVRVYADGTTEEFTPAIPPGSTMRNPTFSDNGNWVAYCVEDPVNLTHELHALDLSNGADGLAQARGITFPIVYPLEQTASCQEIAFSEDETKLALTIFNTVADATMPSWEILIFNLITGAVEKRLSPDSFALAYPDNPQSSYQGLEFCLYLDDSTVIFRLLPLLPVETSYPQSVTSAYSWNTKTDVIAPYPLWDSVSVNIAAVPAAAGQARYEYVWIGADDHFPTAEVRITPDNVVMYSDGSSGSAYPIYTHPEGLGSAEFVDGGRHIVAFAPAYSAGVVIDRNGAQTILSENTNIWRPFFGTDEGFVMVELDGFSGATRLIHYRFTPDGQRVEPTTLWEVLWGEHTPDRYWSLVWCTPMQLAADLQPFPPIQP